MKLLGTHLMPGKRSFCSAQTDFKAKNEHDYTEVAIVGM